MNLLMNYCFMIEVGSPHVAKIFYLGPSELKVKVSLNSK